MPAKRAKKIGFWVAILGVVALMFFWRDIHAVYKEQISAFVDQQRQQGLGEQLDASFSVQDRNGTSVRFRAMFPDGAVVMVYEADCPPCQTAAIHIEASQKRNPSGPTLAILQFDDALAFELTSLKHAGVYLSVKKKDGTPFRGTVTPQFYLLDGSGTIIDKLVGWNPASFDAFVRHPPRVTATTASAPAP